MSRPQLEVADIIRSAGTDFMERNRHWLRWTHLKVMRAIARDADARFQTMDAFAEALQHWPHRPGRAARRSASTAGSIRWPTGSCATSR